MKVKNINPISHIEKKQAHPFIKMFYEISHLKHLFRQGWLHRGVPTSQCETVAEHSFNVAIMAFFLAESWFPELDQTKILRMALLHDLGEIYAGDIVPASGVQPEEKYSAERESLEQTLNSLPNSAVYLQIWEEYEQGDTLEAKFVRQIDRLEMGFQASIYEHQGHDNLDEFFVSVENAVQDPELINLLDQLQHCRAED